MPQLWQIGGGRSLALQQPRLMGILNVTPDSFSDGGAYRSVDEAVTASLCMKDQGACIIDVGGESTRPGSASVDVHEQIRRTVPVIRALVARASSPSTHSDDELLISIDTTRADVAEAALDAGAHIINDTSAGRDDPDMLPLAASRQPRRAGNGGGSGGCGLILMHRRTAPHNDSYSDQYETTPDYGGDVVDFVRRFLIDRCEAAIAAGVPRKSIVIDPGLGFGKSVDQNYELIARTSDLIELGFPVLSAASRKSFIGAAMSLTMGEKIPADRVMGSVAVSVAHFFAGVRLFRVHDVAAHHQALAVAARIAPHCSQIAVNNARA